MTYYVSIESESPIEITLEEISALSGSYIECIPGFISQNFIGIEINAEEEYDTHELVGALVQLLLQREINTFSLNFSNGRQSSVKVSY